jgi:hypothetical protein
MARALAVLAIVLPVPLCAVLGLSLPLPASVARLAAKIVPFSNSARLDANDQHVLGAPGNIVRLAGELPPENPDIATNPGGPLATHGSSGAGVAAPSGKTGETPTALAGQEQRPTAPRQTESGSTILAAAPPVGSTTPNPGGGSTPPPADGKPGPPTVTPTVVDTATATAATVVGTVSATATTAASAVTDNIAPPVATVGGVVTGAAAPLLPKKP